MGFAAIARVTEDRWICCASRDEINFGLGPGGELKVETTICHEIRQRGEGVIIDHVSEDTVYCGHPTPALYGFQSYISIPIFRSDGTMFGTLCAIDPHPHRVNTPEIVGTFKLFAELIAAHLDALQRAESAELLLLDERKVSELREQFIAVLGHDLRNPLAALGAGVRMIERKVAPGHELGEIFRLMANATQRMASLIDNLMDLARARLGAGFTINRAAPVLLGPVLEQVVDELRAGHPDRIIDTDLDLPEPILCDATRVGQLFSNLLGNAITHGSKDHPIRATARSDKTTFELTVSNAGKPIPEQAMPKLFEPFSRGAHHPNQQGLGLGLYISSEIAKAHGGTLGVSSTPAETRFTFRMPVA